MIILDGENLLWKNWDFPIFLINDGNTTQKLYDCYDEHNTGAEATWPLCSVELKSPMYAAKGWAFFDLLKCTH